MFVIYKYNDNGQLIFVSETEKSNELNQVIDGLQADNIETYWEWVEE